MFHFLWRSHLPTLVISSQIFVQYCTDNVSLFAALHSLNGLYKCMEHSQQSAAFMKLAFVWRICLFIFPNHREKHISTVDKLRKLFLAMGAETRIPNFDKTFGRWRSVTSPITKSTYFQIYAQMSEAKRFYRPGSKRTKEFLLAKTMMVLVLVFLILNTPRLILGLYEVLASNNQQAILCVCSLFLANTFRPDSIS